MAFFTVMTTVALAKRNARRPAPEPRTLTNDQVLNLIFDDCLKVVAFFVLGLLTFGVIALFGEPGMRIFAILFDIGCLIGIVVRIHIYRRERDEYLQRSKTSNQ